MPISKTSSHDFATTSSSCSKATVAKTGRGWLELTVGLALCATTQIEQEADSVAVG
jgi:hypothetical protein